MIPPPSSHHAAVQELRDICISSSARAICVKVTATVLKTTQYLRAAAHYTNRYTYY